jgi:hypothetical protein
LNNLRTWLDIVDDLSDPPRLGYFTDTNDKKRDRDAYGTFDTDIIVPPVVKKAKVTDDPDASALSPPASPTRQLLSYELANFEYNKYGEPDDRRSASEATPRQRKPTFEATVQCHRDNNCAEQTFAICRPHQIRRPCSNGRYTEVLPTQSGRFARIWSMCLEYEVPFFSSAGDFEKRMFYLGSCYLNVASDTHTLYHAAIDLDGDGVSIDLGFFVTKGNGPLWHYDLEKDRIDRLQCKLTHRSKAQWHEIVTGPMVPVV